jgi:hypothetical protein
MSTVDDAALLSAVHVVADLLRADGVGLRVVSIDAIEPRVEIDVAFDDVDCDDCVLPPERLHDTVAAALARRAGKPVTVLVNDPRVVVASTGRIVVLDPTGVAPDIGDDDPGPDAGPLRGRTIAIRHDVLWQSFDWTVEEWVAALEAAGASILTWRRVQGLTGADFERAQADYETMLATADVVISGLANCGSCTSWSVRDALSGSARGLPTVAVATEQFEPLARLLAADAGRPGLRVVVLPYPYDTLPEEEVRAHARAAFPRLIEVLGATV